MSQDPLQYQSPPPANPEQSVNGPAIGLMVAGILGIVGQALGLLLHILGIGLNAAPGGRGSWAGMFQGGFGVFFSIIGIAVGVVILMGALKMKKLENYNFAFAASIIAMIPCISPCCLLGLPFGIWALVVLNKPEVKAAFH